MAPGRKRNGRFRGKAKKGGNQNPLRGGPGVLLTCDTGREGKCHQQGLDILQYYWGKQQQQPSSQSDETVEKNSKTDDKSKRTDDEKLSLEDELAALRQESKRSKGGSTASIFAEYHTTCGGTVFILRSKPQKAKASANEKSDDLTSKKDADVEPPNKKQKIEAKSSEGGAKISSKPSESGDTKECEKDSETQTNDASEFRSIAKPAPDPSRSTEAAEKIPSDFDPVELVRQIVNDLKSSAATADVPTSRFITRMIPLQATCFPSEQELQPMVAMLVKRVMDSAEYKKQHDKPKGDKSDVAPAPTFAVQAKRRYCEHLKRNQIIEAVASQVAETTNQGWKVDLKQPDYMVWVEVCQTLCGLSVVSKEYLQQVHNFQLAEVRAQHHAS